MKIQAAKHVAWKQWDLDHLDSVGPEFAAPGKRKERIITPASKRVRHAEFMLGVHLQGEPREFSIGDLRRAQVQCRRLRPVCDTIWQATAR